MNQRKLPIGIQGFEKIRDDHFLYVDKTEYVYQLAHNNIPYFLSRPRRFGKSLLLSTLKAYWEGKRKLFQGLAIETLEDGQPDAWQPHPVFYFDFNGNNYLETPIETVLEEMLEDWEALYGNEYHTRTLGDRFQKVLELAASQTDRRCVVLIDEYDKPLLDTIDQPARQTHIKDVFKGFFSRLKNADESIQFLFITGVSKFHKVSIFSDLNQLKDISLSKQYAALCGITDSELTDYFDQELMDLAWELDLTQDACISALKRRYDGYRFHPDACSVYNPYSLLNALSDREFASYWFETGTPTFLVKKLAHTGFDVRKLTDHTLYASDGMLKDYTGEGTDPIPLLYQTGYLTITDFDKIGREYTLSFPNEEVKYGFLENLMPEYVSNCGAGSGNDIFTLRRYVEQGNLDAIRDDLSSLFANITYTLQADPFEHYFQAVIYLVFTLLGQFASCEVHTYSGRIDCKVETRNYIYLFEFKRDDTARAALEQINSKDYTLPFAADQRTLYKIGVAFDSKSRKLVGWEAEERTR